MRIDLSIWLLPIFYNILGKITSNYISIHYIITECLVCVKQYTHTLHIYMRSENLNMFAIIKRDIEVTVCFFGFF